MVAVDCPMAMDHVPERYWSLPLAVRPSSMPLWLAVSLIEWPSFVVPVQTTWKRLSVACPPGVEHLNGWLSS
jgi:hypothetical protein